MGVLDPTVRLADHDRSVPSGLVPGRHDVLVCTGSAGDSVHCLADVPIRPLQAEGRVVRTGSLVQISGNRIFVFDEVRFRIRDSRLVPQQAAGRADRPGR
jgi:hypothetical protein